MDRNKLIEELRDKFYFASNGSSPAEIADFIISDRQRIIKPLIDFSNIKHNYDTWEIDAGKAMVDTLKLAGIEEMDGK